MTRSEEFCKRYNHILNEGSIVTVKGIKRSDILRSLRKEYNVKDGADYISFSDESEAVLKVEFGTNNMQWLPVANTTGED